MTTTSNKSKKHDVLKRVKYASHFDKKKTEYLDPGQKQVTLEHLSDTDYELLIRKRVYKLAEKQGGKS